MNEASKPGIELRQISKVFGSADVVFRDFSLVVPKGQSIAIVGASGSGKSTLLNLASLLEAPTSGEVWVSGKRKDASAAGTLSLAYIFQRDALLPWNTVLDNVLLGLRCRGVLTPERRSHALDILAEMGLTDYVSRFPAGLSGGQRQLVAIAQNLIMEPSMLFMDEPFASLDFQNKLLLEQKLLDILRGRERDLLTSVLITHDIEEALVLSERILVLGRPAGRPAVIALDINVPVPRAERDPVATRQSPAVRELFREIWHTIRPFVNGGRNSA